MRQKNKKIILNLPVIIGTLLILVVFFIGVFYATGGWRHRQRESMRLLPSADDPPLRIVMEAFLKRFPDGRRVSQWRMIDHKDYNPSVSFFHVQLMLESPPQVMTLSLVCYPSQRIMILDDYEGAHSPDLDQARFIRY